MEPAEILRKAHAAVQEASLPDDLRRIGFERAIDLLMREAVPQVASADRARPTELSEPTGEANPRLAAVAQELGMSGQDVERVFDEFEGNLQFIGNLELFGKSRAAKVAALAILLVAARQAGRYDDGPTPDAVVRAELDRHGILDTGNYGKQMEPARNSFNVNGSGRNATYKMKYEGKQRAKELAQALLKG